MRISGVNLNIIRDSRNKDTLEVEIFSNKNSRIASVPAGKSKGKFEMVSIDPKAALKKFENIRAEIINIDFSSILEFDNFLKKLDGTQNKSSLGGNLILALSIGFTKLFAKANNLQTYQLIEKISGKKVNKFPYLFFNLIGGGLHAENSLPFQEYFLVTKFSSPSKGLEYAKFAVKKLKKDIEKKYGEIRLGDEGTFSINSDDPELGLTILDRNFKDPNIDFALDVAASSFYESGVYKVGEKTFTTDQMIKLYEDLTSKFQLLSIEDPFSENDEKGFVKIHQKLKNKIWIIGDDLTVTNPIFIQKAYDKREITGVIIKPNQIGSVSEVLNAVKLAQSFGWKIIVSHRSGETNDDFIADLAFGIGADGLKSGAPTQPQRLTKYNRLVEIEKSLL